MFSQCHLQMALVDNGFGVVDRDRTFWDVLLYCGRYPSHEGVGFRWFDDT